MVLANHAVEIVADRGIHAHEGQETWSAICREAEAAFGRADYYLGQCLVSRWLHVLCGGTFHTVTDALMSFRMSLLCRPDISFGEKFGHGNARSALERFL